RYELPARPSGRPRGHRPAAAGGPGPRASFAPHPLMLIRLAGHPGQRSFSHGETMTDTSDKIDYSKTLYLPKTDFPMRAGLPEKEPLLVKRWQDMDLYKRLREEARGRPLYVLHDGPPYANGN